MSLPAIEHGMLPESSHVYTYSETDIGRIVNGLEGDTTFLSTPSVLDLKTKYEFESKRICTLELHLLTLGEYHKNGRIPRGLRSQMRPNLFNNDNDFKLRFEQISNKYAFDLIVLNIESLQKELNCLRIKLRDCDNRLKQLLSNEEFAQFLSKQQEFLSKFRKDTEDVKRRKWQREITDYETGRVYTWNNQMQQSNFQTNRRPRPRNMDITTAGQTKPFLGQRTDFNEVVNLQEEGAENGTGAPSARNLRSNQKGAPQTNKRK